MGVILRNSRCRRSLENREVTLFKGHVHLLGKHPPVRVLPSLCQEEKGNSQSRETFNKGVTHFFHWAFLMYTGDIHVSKFVCFILVKQGSQPRPPKNRGKILFLSYSIKYRNHSKVIMFKDISKNNQGHIVLNFSFRIIWIAGLRKTRIQWKCWGRMQCKITDTINNIKTKHKGTIWSRKHSSTHKFMS